MTVPDDCPLARDRRAAQDFVAAVEDGALAGGDADGRVVEADVARFDRAGKRRAAVADLDFAAGGRFAHPTGSGDREIASRSFVASADHDPLTRCVKGGHIERERARYRQALALADREPVHPTVLAEH